MENADLIFRKAQPGDSLAIKQLLKETWVDTYASIMPMDVIETITAKWHLPEIIKAQTTDDRFVTQVCICGDKLCGIIKLQVTSDGKYYLSQLYILPAYQKMKIGSSLLERFIEEYAPKAITLSVEEENKNAISFYTRKRFTETRRLVEDVEGFALKTIQMTWQK